MDGSFSLRNRQLIELSDIVEDGFAAFTADTRCGEDRGELLPSLQQTGAVFGHVAFAGRLAELVELGEHDAERHSVLAEPVEKFHVDLLRFVTRVDEYKKVGHLTALEDIRTYHLLQFIAALLSAAGISVAGEIDDIPLVVY